jgi:hypothetical protein
MAAVASPGRHLIELLEDPRQFGGRNAGAGVPDFHIDMGGRASGHHHHAALRGVLDGVLHQVADDAFEQLRVAGDRLAARRKAQAQTGQLGLPGVLHLQPAKQVAQRKGVHQRRGIAAIQPRDVQHGVEGPLQVFHRAQEVAHQGLVGVCCRRFCSVAANRAQRMHRLAQVVAGDGHEAALFLIGAQGSVAFGFQRAGPRIQRQQAAQFAAKAAVPRPGRADTGQARQHAGESPARHGASCGPCSPAAAAKGSQGCDQAQAAPGRQHTAAQPRAQVIANAAHAGRAMVVPAQLGNSRQMAAKASKTGQTQIGRRGALPGQPQQAAGQCQAGHAPRQRPPVPPAGCGHSAHTPSGHSASIRLAGNHRLEAMPPGARLRAVAGAPRYVAARRVQRPRHPRPGCLPRPRSGPRPRSPEQADQVSP